MNKINKSNTVQTSKFSLLLTAKRHFSLLAVFITLLSLPLGFSGCSSYTETAPNQEETVLVDRTKSNAVFTNDSAQRIVDYVIKSFGISGNSFTSKGILFRLAIVGESARPVTRTITLKPSKPLLFAKKNVRIAEINQFKKEVKTAIFEVLKDSSDQVQSHIGSAICYQLNTLTESTFSEDKSLLILSDGLESTFQMDFISYHNKLKVFEKKYPEFSQHLNQNCHLPKDLSNIKITMVNSPVLGLNEIVLACDKFWVFHLGKSKGKLNIISNL